MTPRTRPTPRFGRSLTLLTALLGLGAMAAPGCVVRADPAPQPVRRAHRAAPARVCPVIHANGRHVRLHAGVYDCDLVVRGNGNTIDGAGPRRTLVRGRLIVTGNGNRFRGFTVRGATRVRGNGNKLRGVVKRGPVRDRGRGNHH